jgi:hypothetical protein
MEQVKVGKSLVFATPSTHNIVGNWSSNKMRIYDDFQATALDAERWVFASNNGGTEAITAAQSGTVTLTTAATDDDRSILATPLIFLCAKNPIIEARFKISSNANVAWNFGFSDATTEGNDALAAEISAGAATLVNGKADDYAGFVYDTDGSVDVPYIAANKAGTEGVPIKATANAFIYGVNTTYKLGTLANAASPMTPYVVGAGSTTLTIQRIGSFDIVLPSGATGTLTNGTGTITGSAVSLVAGKNTVVCTVAGTATLLWGFHPTEFVVARIKLNSTGDAGFFINGQSVGVLPACTTAATPLCAFFGIITRTTAAKVMTVDYFKAWQDR